MMKPAVISILTVLAMAVSLLISPSQAKAATLKDWCAGHAVPESKCTLCNPELIGQFQAAGDWCAEHFLPESVCPKCNPQPPAHDPKDWCAGHDVPESKCTLCNPELIAQFQKSGDWCAEHFLPESVCPKCNPQPPAHDPKDWCAGHDVPESKCTLCNPELIAQFQESGDWCAPHFLPESVCPKCDHGPAKAEANTVALDWCAGHDVPESKCTICNPELIPQFKATNDWCAEHNLPESVCPSCNPESFPPEAIEARIVRFKTPELELRAGIQTEPVQRGRAAETIKASAQFAFHADRVADLRAATSGVVRKIHAELGATVKQGDPLFELESTRVSDTQAHLRKANERTRLAKTNLKRLQHLNEQGMATARELELAQQELESARAETDAAASELRMSGASTTDHRGRFTLKAPIDGVLVRRPAVIGTLATEETSLGMIADTSTMWALCEVPEKEADHLSLGLVASFTLTNGQAFDGQITWIAAEVNPRTRTVKVRAEVPNPQGRLRANQFAQARIETGTSPDALLVPRQAVQRVGPLDVVFVRGATGVYEPRVVSTYPASGMVRVEGRLAAGDPIVTTGAVLLRTEILPGSIGAGCCEVEPLGSN